MFRCLLFAATTFTALFGCAPEQEHRHLAERMAEPLPEERSASEQQWGYLRGCFTYDGDPPAPLPLNIIGADRAAFPAVIESERLVVNQQNGGIANILLYLLPDKDRKLTVHPSYEPTAEAKLELAAKEGRFVPHVVLLRTSQTLVTRNLDPVEHNPGDICPNTPPVGRTHLWQRVEEHRCRDEASLPSRISCSIHPWMAAYVLVRDNPYMAKTDADGRFEIKQLPVGDHVFRVWHEEAGYLDSIRIGPYQTDARGRVTITIRPGNNDLPAIALSPKHFVHE